MITNYFEIKSSSGYEPGYFELIVEDDDAQDDKNPSSRLLQTAEEIFSRMPEMFRKQLESRETDITIQSTGTVKSTKVTLIYSIPFIVKKDGTIASDSESYEEIFNAINSRVYEYYIDKKRVSEEVKRCLDSTRRK